VLEHSDGHTFQKAIWTRDFGENNSQLLPSSVILGVNPLSGAIDAGFLSPAFPQTTSPVWRGRLRTEGNSALARVSPVQAPSSSNTWVMQ
jgi:hypothetical protein